jgi:hypothetical protein
VAHLSVQELAIVAIHFVLAPAARYLKLVLPWHGSNRASRNALADKVRKSLITKKDSPEYDVEAFPRRLSSILGVEPRINVLSHLILGNAVTLLDISLELLALAIYLRKIIVSDLAPLFFDLAARLLPTSFDPIPVHNLIPPRSENECSGNVILILKFQHAAAVADG